MGRKGITGDGYRMMFPGEVLEKEIIRGRREHVNGKYKNNG